MKPADLSTTGKAAVYGVGLAALFGGAVGIGSLVGPVNEDKPPTHEQAHGGASTSAPSGDAHAGHGSTASKTAAPANPAAALPGGLAVAQNGYRLVLDRPAAAAGRQQVAFTIVGPSGRPVTAYDVEHEKKLHLIAVRRDTSGFQHVHPTLGADGRWQTTLDLTAGDWRLYADFKATGAEPLVLGSDLFVPGGYAPVVDRPVSTTATVDGFTVAMSGAIKAGTDSTVTLQVSKAGKPVTDLQPYLGAYGHLVALRGGDLAYLHVHPTGEPRDGKTKPGPAIEFITNAPSPGRYRLFLDFKHGDVVRTAEFTVDVPAPGLGAATPTPAPTPAPGASTSHNADGHAH